MRLFNFMQIDTCPMCGNEIWVTENGYVGTKNVLDIPSDVVFEITCTDDVKNATCGKFQITRKDQSSLVDDWVAAYIPIEDLLERMFE